MEKKKGTAGKLQIDPAKDQVTFMGKTWSMKPLCIICFNKPAGVISATEDDHHQTVLDLLDETARQKEVFPVGRLDIDTHGLLLLTNNGKLAHAMLSPKKHVSKIYRAQVAGIMDEADVARFEAGIALKDFTTLPARLQILEVNEANASSYVEIEIAEGKFPSGQAHGRCLWQGSGGFRADFYGSSNARSNSSIGRMEETPSF